MSTLNCIIVDDENLSRKAVERCVNLTGFLNLIGVYSNAIEAKEGLKEKKVDLIFLDINMPEMSGLEFIQTFRDVPQIIVVSSHKEFAFEAFRFDVTDYISKPVDYARFLKAAEKAQKVHESIDQKENDGNGSDFIFVKSDFALHKLNLKDILYVEALGDYVKIFTEESRLLVLSTMKAISTKLPENDFMRIHKSYIVRLDKIQQIEGNMLRLGKNSIPVSRTQKDALISRFNLL